MFRAASFSCKDRLRMYSSLCVLVWLSKQLNLRNDAGEHTRCVLTKMYMYVCMISYCEGGYFGLYGSACRILTSRVWLSFRESCTCMHACEQRGRSSMIFLARDEVEVYKYVIKCWHAEYMRPSTHAVNHGTIMWSESSAYSCGICVVWLERHVHAQNCGNSKTKQHSCNEF
jgi:hypothetical protein